MKVYLNKIILIICINLFFFSCNNKEDDMVDYVGLYCYKQLYTKKRILEYIILKEDSTYIRKYISEKEQIEKKGRWKYGNIIFRKEDNYYLDLYDWCWFNEDKPFYGNQYYPSISPFDFSPNLLRFDPDIDVDFWRIDSLEAASLGIKEDGVQW